MSISTFATAVFEQEARSLRTRVARLRPLSLLETMVPAANLPPAAQRSIEQHLASGRQEIEGGIDAYLRWLNRRSPRGTTTAEAQRRLTLLRMRWGAVLSDFDLFGDVVTQRSEHETGVWLAGLDVAADDGMRVSVAYPRPPVICYLDRGAGGAIRRARTRLPTGTPNPVAVIRVPRERMVATGIASTLMHEVGHQAAALLEVVPSLQEVFCSLQHARAPQGHVWAVWERWLSEILADFWAIAQVGIASTVGLIAVVSLPRPFVFRFAEGDPHPAPYLRVHLSCALGNTLYPDPQWSHWARLWEAMYPQGGLPRHEVARVSALLDSIPTVARLIAHHRPRRLGGRSLAEVFDRRARHPMHLRKLYGDWLRRPAQLYRASPALAFAVLGQARADQHLTAEVESELIARLLRHWALTATDRRTLANLIPQQRPEQGPSSMNSKELHDESTRPTAPCFHSGRVARL